jgi:hypothetical protein
MAPRLPLGLLLGLLLLGLLLPAARANTIVQLRFADGSCGAGGGAAAKPPSPYPLTAETVPAGAVCAPGVRPYDGGCQPLPEAGTSIRAMCIPGDLPDSWVALPPRTPLPATLAVALSYKQPRCNGGVAGVVAYFSGVCAPVPPSSSSQMSCSLGRARMYTYTTATCDPASRVHGSQDLSPCSLTGNTRMVCVTVAPAACRGGSGWIGVDALSGRQKCL